MIPPAIGRESSASDRNAAFPGDPGGFWSPKEVTRRIRATEKTATAIQGRYSDELLAYITLTDSPLGDFMTTLPAQPAKTGQINVYTITAVGTGLTSIHFDLYNHTQAGNTVKAVNAPFSHDAEANPPVREPASLATAGLCVFLGLGYAWRRRKRVAA